MSENPTHPPRMHLDRHLAGELSEPELQKVVAHLATCNSCATYVKQMEEARQLLMHRLPPWRIVHAAQQRARRRWGRHPLAIAAPVAAFTSCVLFLVLAPQLWKGNNATSRERADVVTRPAPEKLAPEKLAKRASESTTRWMGTEVAVQVTAKHGTNLRKLASDEAPRKGDLLRFDIGWATSAPRWIALVALEGNDILLLGDSPRRVASRNFSFEEAVDLSSIEAPVRLLVVARSAPFAADGLRDEVKRLRAQRAISALDGLLYDQTVIP